MSFTRDMKIRHLEGLAYETEKASFFASIEGKTQEELAALKSELVAEKEAEALAAAEAAKLLEPVG
jgi:hypothetical protein